MRIENETALIPAIIADCVCNELLTRNLLQEDWSAPLYGHLVARAERCYGASEHFRKKLKGRGNRGRDHLYAFMRHWASGFILKHLGKSAFDQLPEGFSIGIDPRGHLTGPAITRQ